MNLLDVCIQAGFCQIPGYKCSQVIPLHLSGIEVYAVIHAYCIIVTVFWKTDHIDTNAEIHFLPEDEGHTHALFRGTKHLRLDGQVCFYRQLFSEAVKPGGCLSWPLWPLRGINKTAWGAKLIVTAGLAYPVSCASLAMGHLLMAKHCPLSLKVCFTLPTAPLPPPPPTPPPSHPSTHPYRLNPCYNRS